MRRVRSAVRRARSPALPLTPRVGAQDDAKEETTVSTLIERVSVDEILEAKKEEAERQKLKAQLTKQMNKNDLFDLE